MAKSLLLLAVIGIGVLLLYAVIVTYKYRKLKKRLAGMNDYRVWLTEDELRRDAKQALELERQIALEKYINNHDEAVEKHKPGFLKYGEKEGQ